MEFHELSDDGWCVVLAFLPPKPGRGGRALSDDGSLINGILYVVATGFRWRVGMPRNYGSYVTAEEASGGVWVMEFLSSMRGMDV